MDNDDDPVGRVLTRRQAIAAGGTAAAAFLAGCSSGETGDSATETTTASAMSPDDPNYPANGTVTETTVATGDGATACVAQPELTEGPYYVDENLRRSDVRVDTSTGEREPGTPLALGFRVFELGDDGCTALVDALVDVWHANASGVYSDVRRQGTVGRDFLRGIQTTDADGAASFTTVYPGWYTGRAVHIHFKIRSSADSETTYEFTSQLFFDDDLTDRVYAQDPYAERGERDTANAADDVFGRGNAAQLLLDVTQTEEGYAGTLNVALYTA